MGLPSHSKRATGNEEALPSVPLVLSVRSPLPSPPLFPPLLFAKIQQRILNLFPSKLIDRTNHTRAKESRS
jgi:hypothetical protein